MEKNEMVAIITIGTIVDNTQPNIANDLAAKEDLVKRLKSGWKIVSAVPTSTQTQACITYVLNAPLGKWIAQGLAAEQGFHEK